MDKYITKRPTTKRVLGESFIDINGKVTTKINKETFYPFEYPLLEVSNIEDCHNKWLDDWENELEGIKELTKSGFRSDLDYEVNIISNYPALAWDSTFLKLLGDCGINFSMYIWPLPEGA